MPFNAKTSTAKTREMQTRKNYFLVSVLVCGTLVRGMDWFYSSSVVLGVSPSPLDDRGFQWESLFLYLG